MTKHLSPVTVRWWWWRSAPGLHYTKQCSCWQQQSGCQHVLVKSTDNGDKDDVYTNEMESLFVLLLFQRCHKSDGGGRGRWVLNVRRRMAQTGFTASSGSWLLCPHSNPSSSSRCQRSHFKLIKQYWRRDTRTRNDAPVSVRVNSSRIQLYRRYVEYNIGVYLLRNSVLKSTEKS